MTVQNSVYCIPLCKVVVVVVVVVVVGIVVVAVIVELVELWEYRISSLIVWIINTLSFAILSGKNLYSKP